MADISIEVPAGKTVALVGPSGSGKSTILNLIPRFYDVDAGAVTIDSNDVRQVTLASLRAAIALVSQEVSLFDDTVRANIAYGRFDSTPGEIEAAAKQAAAHEFITELPDGYDTVVGEHGIKLSGGQRQRIGIANVNGFTGCMVQPADCNVAAQNNFHRAPQKVGERPKPLPLVQTD